jgi:hypothetical protein
MHLPTALIHHACVNQLTITLICYFYGTRYKNTCTVADCCVMVCDTVYTSIQTRCARMHELQEGNVVEHRHAWTIDEP